MKYAVVIIDGAADRPLANYGHKTPLELADIPNLNGMAKEGLLGMVHNVPAGMEPGSAVACMSVLGYDPLVYYRGRSAIEAKSLNVPLSSDDVVFRCNLVAIRQDIMWSYCAGHISTEEASQLIAALNETLGNNNIRFFPGISYRHILRITGAPETLKAECTPPHDISDKDINHFLPKGEGSQLLNDLMEKSKEVLSKHPVNQRRIVSGEIPANQIWLFWGSGRIPQMPAFKDIYKLEAAIISGVDLLKGLGNMMSMEVLNIPGVTDGQDNDYAAQAEGALKSLQTHDLVFIHIEAPDEAAHEGLVEQKIEAIEKIDKEIVRRLLAYKQDKISIMALPDHPTPIETKTHSNDPVPFLLWGQNIKSSDSHAYNEKEAMKSGIVIDKGHNLMQRFLYGE